MLHKKSGNYAREHKLHEQHIKLAEMGGGREVAFACEVRRAEGVDKITSEFK